MNKLADAVIFSRKYTINFRQELPKVKIEELFKQLIEQISRPLSHNGIILGHIKLIASICEEKFMFLSVTRVDNVDAKFSSNWVGDLALKSSKLDLDINVLIYGYSRETIEHTVKDALSALCCETIIE